MIQIQLYNQDKTTCCFDVSLATKRRCTLSHCFILATWLEKLFARPILATLALGLLRSSSSHKSLNSFARVLFFSAIQGKTWKLSPWLMVSHSMVGINEDQDLRGEFGFSSMSTLESICTFFSARQYWTKKPWAVAEWETKEQKLNAQIRKNYILLMEEILYHLGCIKSYGYWDIYYINWCRISEPSTAWHNRHHPVLCSVSWGATSWPVPQEKPLEATKEIPGESNIILHQDEVVSL